MLLGKNGGWRQIFIEVAQIFLVNPLCRRGRGEQVLKVATKCHYKRRSEFVDKQLNISIGKSLVVKMTCCWFLCLHFFMCGTMSANHIGIQIKMWVQQLLLTGANLDMGVTSGKPYSIDKSREWIFNNY